MPEYNLQLIGFVLFALALYWVFTRFSVDRTYHHDKPILSVSELAMVIVCILLILAALFWR